MAGILNNDSIYQTYSKYLVTDVPSEHLKHLVYIFIQLAGMNMGANMDKANVDRMIEIICEDYSTLPINQIASAFSRGSMGYFGEGRLIPKNINNWLKETKQDYERWKEHREREEALSDFSKFSDFDKYPLGKAIMKKIDWQKAGILNDRNWDLVPLKELSEMIGKGRHPLPEDFKL